MDINQKKILFIAGGGTGGHIYPGVAIAREIIKLNPQIEIHFVGTNEGLESKILLKEGFKLHLIQGGKLNFSGHFFRKIKTLFKIPIGLVQSILLIQKYKPQFVLGVGGFASGPMVLMSSFFNIPTAIWEPNAHPGLANRMLSKFVNSCYLVFEEAKKELKNKNIKVFGMPVRAEIENAKRIEKADPDFHLLSFGGSQGSRAISTVLSAALIERGDWTRGLKVVHQIGALDFTKVSQKYSGVLDFVTPKEFIFDMPNYYSWADLAVVRGGASTLMELAAWGLVPIVIPLPAADDHQQKNAETLVESNAGVMILQKDLTKEKLIEEIQKFRTNPERIKKYSENIKKLFIPKSSEKIALDILSQLEK